MCLVGTSSSNRYQIDGTGFGEAVHESGLGQCSDFKIGPQIL